MDYSVNILMFDNSNHILTSLECKDHVKYVGVLLDSHLSWKYHIDNVSLKISRIIGVIARLQHLVPFTTLLTLLLLSLYCPFYKISISYESNDIFHSCLVSTFNISVQSQSTMFRVVHSMHFR